MIIRNVSVLMLFNKGKILLQKRSKTAKRFPGRWGLFGGGIEGRETPKAALKREILEELNLVVTKPVFFREYPYIYAEKEERGEVWVYFQEYNGEKLNLQEGQEMKWASLPDSLKLDLHPIYREILEDIGQRRGSVVL